MTQDNSAEVAFWNGDAAARWVAYQERIDPCIRPFGLLAMDALAALRPLDGARVLDVGCGCGDTTAELARRVGERGEVIGVDVSRPMLARAAERLGGDQRVRFLEGDAAAIEAGPLDALFSRFGVMFFADPAAAFGHLRAQLAPGAPIAFVCWKALGENPWAAEPLAAVVEIVGRPPPPAPGAPGPFAFASEERVRGVLEAAGFHDVRHAAHVLPFRIGESLEDALDQAAGMGPASRLLRESPEELRAPARDALRAWLERLTPRFERDGAVWVVTARA
ncbi:MAG: class I SAM-dependent methyltransferase [Polyangiaceae bacterium]|nr:class I SAM-dependent methyltransferase [Polyangiaceae bacterium]